MPKDSAAPDVPPSQADPRRVTTAGVEGLDVSKLLVAKLVDVCAVGTPPNDMRFQLLMRVAADQPIVLELTMAQLVAVILANDRVPTLA